MVNHNWWQTVISGIVWPSGATKLALNLQKDFFSRKEASTFLESLGCPISPRALERMAANGNAGDGPPYLRVKWRHVRYKRVDLINWAVRNTIRVE